ncbi:hypothetical protein ASPACDRAFT_1854323 [Aspergillus aculeatus ATCC 16872]|uniref:Blastomyces yeast-phase-specific protein n=1 Tax=Aspergillus aculeatus (strain ATCC 16872 / CBS 172.66 / WB 5094) TaxID=690307 RepID=A0A1L9X1M0_ASPA1|nr:uncharacterized protein ASPACDRAFT_1854323 [Aspergillus aculeatus ATCC 16872]OJK02343.1 hypothetical protein ASPACDRAFT_1854323 [Aspergillus aculeatus ATCC 16872]
MHFLTLLLLLLPLLPLTTTATATATATATPDPQPLTLKPANATIHNLCPFPIYLTAVSSTTPPEIPLPPNTTWTEPYRHDPQTGGISLKLTTVPNGLYTGAAQTIFAYNYLERTGQVWFDLSDVFGDPFKGFRVRLGPMGPAPGNASEMIVWEDGVPPRGSQVRVVGCEVGLGLGVCV